MGLDQAYSGTVDCLLPLFGGGWGGAEREAKWEKSHRSVGNRLPDEPGAGKTWDWVVASCILIAASFSLDH